MSSEGELIQSFPRLATDPHFEITSPEDTAYNCVAWAAEDTTLWWWPTPPGMVVTRAGVYWPPGLPQNGTLQDFVVAFEARGYEVAEDADPEEGYEKVALYVDQDGNPTHAAREAADGWTSKLGEDVDIGHETPSAVGGDEYGEVAVVLRRPLD